MQEWKKAFTDSSLGVKAYAVKDNNEWMMLEAAVRDGSKVAAPDWCKFALKDHNL
jgi:hypothetical protein